MCIFLTNILQNRRKRISAKLPDGGTRYGQTLFQPATIGPERNALKCFGCCIEKERKKEGREGWGWRPAREPPLKLIQFLWCFCGSACVVVIFTVWGGINCRILKGGATEGCFSEPGDLHVSMDLIRVFQ